MNIALIDRLSTFSESDWLIALEQVLPSIHEVDRDAVQIWFRFYPLSLHRYIATSADREETLRGLNMLGSFELKDQIDTSHHFLYGHRFWKATKCSIAKEIDEYTGGESLVEIIKEVGIRVAEK